MVRPTLLVSFVSAILVSSLMSSAFAQNASQFRPARGAADNRGTVDDQAACQHDAVTLCKSVLGDDMQVLACFQRQRAKLSKGCNAVLVKYGQ